MATSNTKVGLLQNIAASINAVSWKAPSGTTVRFKCSSLTQKRNQLSAFAPLYKTRNLVRVRATLC